MSKELAFAKNLALEAGEVMKKYFLSDKQEVSTKQDNSVLTIADTTINTLVIKLIKEQYPQDSILGEEESHLQENSKYTWVCDPIDGTRLYALGVPTSMFSLARLEEGQPVLAVAYNPFVNHLYTAQKGQGAFLNDKSIRVHATQEIAEIPILLSVSRREPYTVELTKHLIKQNCPVHDTGSAVHNACLVARGAVGAHVFPFSMPWEAAAVALIVEEAGGRFTGLDGENQRYDEKINGFVATNGLVHEEVLEYVRLAKQKTQDS
ncbi:MAG: inositol monophosphatase family protein [Candidatus Woesearchaeota archaeon]